MGSIIGAHLARAGHSVAMLARGRRAQDIQEHGLRIKGLVEFSTPVQTLTDPAQLRGAQVLIVTTKALGTAAALEPLRRADVGVAFSVQNGVMKNELLAAAFGRARVLGSLANISGELLESGEVLFTRNVNVFVGDLPDGINARTQDVARTLDNAGVRSTAVANIQGQEWSKFAGWVGLVALSLTTRVSTWKYLSDADAALLLVRLVREVGVLANACGVELTDDSLFPVATLCRASEPEAVAIIQRFGDEFRRNSPLHRLSTLQDLEAGRALEIEETLGFAVSKAAELKQALPLLDATFRIASAIDRTRKLG